MYHPTMDKNDDNIPDQLQDTVDGDEGDIAIEGQFFTKEQIAENLRKRELAYFDLLEIAERVNRGLIGPLTK